MEVMISENIWYKGLEMSKMFPYFVVPNVQKSLDSRTYIQAIAFYKAKFPLMRFYFGGFGRLATIKGGFASLYLHIFNIFCHQMPNVTKNLHPTARRASAATSALRQEAQQPTMPPCCYCTLQAEQSLKTYRIRMHMLASLSVEDFRGGILNTDNYMATNKYEAIGMAVEQVSKLHPHYCIVVDNINVQLVTSVRQRQ